ncbi:MAG: hypothetical protein Kapaf2KO_02800 [Candidatus Kapaibacteriales bacterium]
MKNILLLLSLPLFTLLAQSETQPEEPTDTDGNGYINISTLAHLRWLSESPDADLTANYELDNDIDASETREWNVGDHDGNSNTPDSAMGWISIGSSDKPFYGKLNGNNFAILSLFARKERRPLGLISVLKETGIVKDIAIEDVFFQSRSVGGIVAENYGVIDKCENITNLEDGRLRVGGIAGSNHGIIKNSTNYGKVFGSKNIGGITGYSDSLIVKCINYGQVQGEENIGGIIGFGGGGILSLCEQYGKVSGEENIGGICGDGYRIDTIQKSLISGFIEGIENIGGAAGILRNNGIVLNNFSSDSIEIDGEINVGGMVGTLEKGIIKNNYSTKLIDENVGYLKPFVGIIKEGEVTSCYWNSGNKKPPYYPNNGNPLSENMLKNWKYFRDWDFNEIWAIDINQNNGFPFIREMNHFDNTPIDDDKNGYIELEDCKDFAWFSRNKFFWFENFELLSDIDIQECIDSGEELGYLSLGDGYNPFGGIFNGNNHVISNVYINRGFNTEVGFFGITSKDAVIHNLYFENIVVIGNGRIGCVVGSNGGIIREVGVVGTVDGNFEVGAITGHCELGAVIDCFAIVEVRCTDRHAGGLVGNNVRSRVINSYSVNKFSGNVIPSGLIAIDDGSIVTSSYWDAEVSGITTSEGGSPRTTAEMKTKSNYVDWDFDDIWAIDPNINDGYPYLRGLSPVFSVQEDYATEEQEIHLFPNPATQSVNITSLDAFNQVEIISSSGNIVRSEDISGGTVSFAIENLNLTPGSYFVIVKMDGNIVSLEKLQIRN